MSDSGEIQNPKPSNSLYRSALVNISLCLRSTETALCEVRNPKAMAIPLDLDSSTLLFGCFSRSLPIPLDPDPSEVFFHSHGGLPFSDSGVLKGKIFLTFNIRLLVVSLLLGRSLN